MDANEFKALFLRTVQNQDNPYHPLTWINGSPEIGSGTYIGGFSEINAKGARVVIGRDCDIASFVAINVADSHRRCIGLADANECRDIRIGDCVFIGSHSAIFGGAVIGDYTVIGAGTIVRAGVIPPFSLAIGNDVRPGYYRAAFEARQRSRE
jgi:acetyltransferase-like isoleucine patch superfamily enzyme